ncbi:MAG: 1-hydroxycarotenoid 3,4-desaturase CrtD [Bacteroidota bacterium]
MKKKAVVIGSGIGGIATAIRLAVKDMEVTVFEKDKNPGGKLNLIELDGYRFDLGPSLFTMPFFVEELFQLAGKDHRDYFRYKKIDLACKYFWRDGTTIYAWSDKKKLAEEIEKKLGVDPEIIEKYVSHALNLYEKTSPVFLEKSLHKLKNYLSYDFLVAGTYFHQMDIFQTMDEANRKRLKHPKLVQMFNRMATYNGSSPFKAPGILNIISSLEHGTGVYFPEGGMYNITLSLYNLARELGVKFRFSEEVREIKYKDRKVQGVKTSLNEYTADIVISNMDIVPSYRKLLPGVKRPERTLRQERSSSALVFYWGIKNTYPELELHNIFFSNNYKEEFEYLFEGFDIHNDPTIYINISSKESPGDVPEGHENWFVMVNAPHNQNQDWEEIIQRTRKNISSKLSKILNKDIEKDIEAEYILDPREIESKTSSYKGSLYGSSSNSKFAAFLRHPNFSSRLNGLYFVGGSVHPGGGIPLCLLSAKITAGLIN